MSSLSIPSSNISDVPYMALPEISADDTLGAAFIGYGFACTVFGVLTSQVMNYHQKYATDPKPVRILVGIVCSISNVDARGILIRLKTFRLSISNDYRTCCLVPCDSGSCRREHSAKKLDMPPQTDIFDARPCQESLLNVSGRNTFIAATISFVVMAQFAFAVAAYKLESLLYLSNLRMVGSIALAAGALVQRARFALKQIDGLCNQHGGPHESLLTPLPPSMMSLLTLVLYDARPNTFQFMGVYFVLSKTFAVSLMCTLNTRKEMGGLVIDEEAISNHDSETNIIPSNDTSTVSTAFRMEFDYSTMSSGSVSQVQRKYNCVSFEDGHEVPHVDEKPESQLDCDASKTTFTIAGDLDRDGGC
ncbi:hypothetical protein EV360DRAFT_71591 [Lentinula raphanica]|nr:hypothetical protein EV360DRAFT_71591 [Lentinula raphanica]